jgi:hypothetical protein
MNSETSTRDSPAREHDASTGRGIRYAAFISYSHAGDRALASALQAGLHRFAKPWHRLRALRVFRDEASLAANPRLWGSISEALLASKSLILLASPEAARSDWVARELALWASEKSRENLLIVVTDGAVRWDPTAGDFDWHETSALPRMMGDLLEEDPEW